MSREVLLKLSENTNKIQQILRECSNLYKELGDVKTDEEILTTEALESMLKDVD